MAYAPLWDTLDPSPMGFRVGSHPTLGSRDMLPFPCNLTLTLTKLGIVNQDLWTCPYGCGQLHRDYPHQSWECGNPMTSPPNFITFPNSHKLMVLRAQPHVTVKEWNIHFKVRLVTTLDVNLPQTLTRSEGRVLCLIQAFCTLLQSPQKYLPNI